MVINELTTFGDILCRSVDTEIVLRASSQLTVRNQFVVEPSAPCAPEAPHDIVTIPRCHDYCRQDDKFSQSSYHRLLREKAEKEGRNFSQKTMRADLGLLREKTESERSYFSQKGMLL